MGPVGHLGISLAAGWPLKLNLPVVAVTSLLPDLVDKPLWVLGMGSGRYVGHTLLFVFLVAIVLSIRKRIYGLSALFGGMSHLFLDSQLDQQSLVPWFYPFVSYDFPHRKFSWSGLYARLSAGAGEELMWVVAACVAACLILWLISRLRKRMRKRLYDACQSDKRADGNGV